MMNNYVIKQTYGDMPDNWVGSKAMLIASVVFDNVDSLRLKCPAFFRYLGDRGLPPGKLILLVFIHSVSGKIILSPTGYTKIKEQYFTRSQFRFFMLVDS